MRHILQGFTFWVGGVDFGYDAGTVQLPMPTPVTQNYRGGGMDMEVAHPMAAIEALEATVKMSGHNPDIMKLMARGPGKVSRLTFRAAVQPDPTSAIVPHVCVIEGCPNFGGRDEWERGEKSGLEFILNGIIYFRYEVGPDKIHELQAWPAKRIVNGIDELAEVNAALGY